MVTITKDTHILYFEPQNTASEVPVNDELTVFFNKIFNNSVAHDIYYKGVHRCICGKTSSNHDYDIVMGDRTFVTNSLALHYLQFHRDEVPTRDIVLIQQALNKVSK